VPADPARSRLQSTIDQLATALEAPPFMPHITLASVDSDHGTVTRAVDAVAGPRRPLTMVAGATSHDAEWSRTLVIEFDDEPIAELAHELCESLTQSFDPSGFKPHLSLLYRQDLEIAVRETLTQRYRFAGEQLRFDTLVAMHAPNGAEDVAWWDTSIAATLVGGGSEARRSG